MEVLLSSYAAGDASTAAISHTSSNNRYGITLLIALVTAIIFFHSVLPRIPQLLLRGKLRVKRVGLRGIRGIEWRSKGFKRPQPAAFSQKDASFEEEETDEDDASSGLVVKVGHIYLQFHSSKQAKEMEGQDMSSSSGGSEPMARETTQESSLPSASKAWVTIRVEGVGVILPRSRKSEEDTQKRFAEKEAQMKLAQEAAQKEREAEEERLNFLMQSRPSSPALGASRSRSASPMPAFATAMKQGMNLPNQESAGGPAICSPALPLQVASRLYRLAREDILPAVWLSLLKILRLLIYLITSALPFLTSIVDLEVTRLEIYSKEADTVARIEKIVLDLDMSLVLLDEKNGKGKDCAGGKVCRGLAKSWSDSLVSMPSRIGTGAIGAASMVTAGLPAGNVSLRLSTTGLQVFEASLARRQPIAIRVRSSSSSKDGDTTQMENAPPSSPPLASPNLAQSSEFPDFQSFSSLYSAPPPLPLPKRSRSFTSFTNLTTYGESSARLTDWALGMQDEDSNSSSTGWRPGTDDLRRATVHPSARLLSMPETSTVNLGLFLSSSPGSSAKEGVHIDIRLAAAAVGVDALSTVLETLENRKAVRNGIALSKESEDRTQSPLSKQEKPQTQVRLLERLGSASFAWPSVKLVSSSKTSLASLASTNEANSPDGKMLPSSVQLQAELRDISCSIKTSDPADDAHQRWLGTCGIKGYRPQRNTKGFADRFRWNPSQRKVQYIEHRRAFNIEAGFASVEVRAGVDGESRDLHSELLLLTDLAIRARSTWTPFGLISSAKEQDRLAPRYFRSDPNEQAMVVEATLSKVCGDLKTRHATALLAFARLQSGKSKEKRERLGLQKEPPSRPDRFLESVPKLSIGVQFDDLSYRLDSSELMHATPLEQRLLKPEASLILAVPQVNFAFHGSYIDQYVKRSELERKAAWRSLAKDELEWSLNEDIRGQLRHQLEEGRSRPRSPGGDYRSWQEEKAKEEEEEEEASLQREDEQNDGLDNPDQPEREFSHPESMTIKEALRRMRELQEFEALRNQPDKQRAFTVKNKWKAFARKKARLEDTCPYNTRYSCEGQVMVDSVEIFWAISGDATSTRRRTQDDKEEPTTAAARLTTTGLAKHHVLALSTFEADVLGHLPGFQSISSHGVRLDAGKREIDTRVMLEEVDLDLWQGSAMDASKRLIDLVATMMRDSAQGSSGTDMSVQDEKGEQQSLSPPPALLDVLVPGASAYISIGSIIAHVGGIDELCDNKMSRGLGFEAKRAVVELACFQKVAETKRPVDSVKLGLGARSALELPEDSRSSCGALALRHGKAALAKLSLFEIGLFPLLDAEQATAQHLQRTAEKQQDKPASNRAWPNDEVFPVSPSIIAPAVWEFQKTRPQASHKKRQQARFRQQDRSNFIFWMPFSATKASLIPEQSKQDKIGKSEEQLTIRSEGTKLLSFKLELLHTYCVLMAFASLKRLKPTVKRRPTATDKEQPKTAAKKSPSYREITHHLAIDVSEIHLSIFLPGDVNLFASLRRLECIHSKAAGISVGFETLMAAVESPVIPSKGMWEEIVRMRDFRISTEPPKDGLPRAIIVNGDGAKLRVPFGYTVHPLIDNTVVAVKATKQLLHQFLTGKNNSIIRPEAEDPKHLPIIRIRIRILALQAEDDPFETRLNLIWRAGGDEHQARAERNAAFEEKVSHLEKMASKFQGSSATIASYPDTLSSYSDDETAADSGPKSAIEVKASIEQARRTLDAFNASSWIRRYTNAKAEQGRREDMTARQIYGRLPNQKLSDLPIKMAPPSRAAPLFRSTMTTVEVEVRPTTFPETKLRDFLHEQGQGMPKDLEYSLLVPMHLTMRLSEWRITLRDYPLPLLHIPPTSSKLQADNLPAWEMSTDMCIGEQLGGESAIRQVTAIVVPAATGRPDAIEYGLAVPKMAMPTKFFGSPTIRINSCFPTRLVWGQSLQPAIHDVVRVIEGITSPPHDPSPRIGFWDKLSLIFHGRVLFHFAGEGELHLYLKGSRDPYHILEHGAGWVKCWRGNVKMQINYPNEDNEVFQIISDEYLLAIPDLKDYIDRAATGTSDGSSNSGSDNRRSQDSSDRHSVQSSVSSLSSSQKRYMKEPDFKKVCLKLTNGVRWGSALHLERTCTKDTCIQKVECTGTPFHRECRFWERKPHWEVYTRTHAYAATMSPEEFGDSYEGWRSHHLHFSISIYSPKGGLRSEEEKGKKTKSAEKRKEKDSHECANNLYFTPLAWEHFWAWARLFDSALSLPIRQGPLFPGSMAQSPKFGRHLGTIKYRFNISPLFVAHVYPQDDKWDWARGITTLIGVKARLSEFHMDLHQRQQEMVKDRPELGEKRKVLHKPFYEAEVDLTDIDLRTLSGQFVEPDKRLFPQDEYGDDDSHQAQHNVMFGGAEECQNFDKLSGWHDLQDFVELDWAPPTTGKQPKIRLIRAMACPRFNFYRHTESQREARARTKRSAADRETEKTTQENESDDAHSGAGYVDDEQDSGEGSEDGVTRLEKSKFGREGTHTCLVGKAASTHSIQVDLAQQRLHYLTDELDRLKEKYGGETTNLSDSQAHLRDTDGNDTIAVKMLDLQQRIDMIQSYIKMLHNVMHSEKSQEDLQEEVGTAAYSYFATPYKGGAPSLASLQAIFHEWEAYDNRYFAHNPSIFYSNATRDVLLRYYLSSRKRRGVVQSLSAKAVRYLRELSSPPMNSKEKHDSRHGGKGGTPNRSKEGSHSSRNESDDGLANSQGPELLRGLLRDTIQYIVPNDDEVDEDQKDSNRKLHDDTFQQEEVDPAFGISSEYEVRKSNVCVLLKPQVVLRSLVDDSSTMILTAIRTRMHNYSVKDPQVEEDSVNERVLYRNYFSIDGLQAFHPSNECAYLERARQQDGFLYVPLETLIDLKYQTRDFHRITPRTDASMHYDKFNKLRMYDINRPVVADIDSQDPAIDHLRHSMDLIRLRCPSFAVMANAEHFGAIYNIVTDLLLHRDPVFQEQAKRRELMMLSYDLSDHQSLAPIVQALQVRIRHAKELHVQYQLHFQHLNEQGRLDFLALKAEMKDMIDELTLLLDATKIVDDQSSSDKEKKSALRVEALANNIAWNMMGRQEGELLAKMTIKGASFTWLNKADNSAANTLSIADLNAVNVRPNAVFSEIITKYHRVENHPMKQKGMLLHAMWSVLAPVGGIAIMDHLEVALHPLRIQLERSNGKQLEEYLFGSKREREKKDREQRETEEALQEQANGKSSKKSAFKRLANVVRNRDNAKEEKEQGSDSRPPSSEQRRQPASDRKSSTSLNKDGKMNLPMDKRRAQLMRSSSMSLSAKSSVTDLTSMNSPSSDDPHSGADSEGEETGDQAIAAKNAIEMRTRASRNTTFVYAKVTETIFCLSYKGEKQKSITDLYDLVFRSPRLEYRNRTWANADLAHHLKRDILRAAWSQKSTLLKGVIHHRRPRHQAVADNIRAIRDAQLTRKVIAGATGSSSTLLSGNSEQAQIKDVSQDIPEHDNDRDSSNDEMYDRENMESSAPAFRLNVDPPESPSSSGGDAEVASFTDGNGPHMEDREDLREKAEGAEPLHDPRAGDLEQHRTEASGAATGKLGKFISRTLGGGKKSRSSSLTSSKSRRSSVAADKSRRSSTAYAHARSEYQQQQPHQRDADGGGSSGADSDNDDRHPPNDDDDDADDDNDDDHEGVERMRAGPVNRERWDGEDEHAILDDESGSSSQFASPRRQSPHSSIIGGGGGRSSSSSRSMRSPLASRLPSSASARSGEQRSSSTPAIGDGGNNTANNPSNGNLSGTSGPSSLMNAIKLAPSLPKMHAPWQSRKDADESPSIAPRSDSTEEEKARALLGESL